MEPTLSHLLLSDDIRNGGTAVYLGHEVGLLCLFI